MSSSEQGDLRTPGSASEHTEQAHTAAEQALRCGARGEVNGLVWVCNKPAGHGEDTPMRSYERLHSYRTPNGVSQVSWQAGWVAADSTG